MSGDGEKCSQDDFLKSPVCPQSNPPVTSSSEVVGCRYVGLSIIHFKVPRFVQVSTYSCRPPLHPPDGTRDQMCEISFRGGLMRFFVSGR